MISRGTVEKRSPAQYSAALASGQRQMLQHLASGATLDAALTALLAFLEVLSPELVGSILLLDPDGIHLRHGAAPSLPRDFVEAIDGSAIGSGAGSCGTAAFRGKPVWVNDIATDPLWTNYRHLALPLGFRACWSTPILDGRQQVLGTFALYRRRPGPPSRRDRALIEMATPLAAVAIGRSRDAVLTRTATEPPRLGGAPDADPALLELYSRSLIRKLEEKTLQLDEVNRALQDDIAERIRTEAELKRIAAQLRQQAQLLDKAQDAILVRDLDHTVRYWNRSAERLYGWTAEEAVGRSIRDLIYNDTTAFEAASAEALAHGEWSGEIDQRTKDGRPITVEGHWTLVCDDDGRPMATFVINTDVTHRKALELQFLRAQRLESVGTMAGGIAHDLNNVLSPILISIGLLKQSLQRPENLEILDLMERSATRGADMVAQVLAFARGVEGGRVRTSIGHAARDVARIASETFPKNIAVTTHVPSDLWTIEADPTQLHQVLLNLCVNAGDAMPEGGQLVIRARNQEVTAARAATLLDVREGSYIVVEILDTGSGIPPDLMDKIFDPFFTTKDVGKGTGLGLSTSMAIVKRHDGILDCESRLGHGTTFRLYLPARPDLAEGS